MSLFFYLEIKKFFKIAAYYLDCIYGLVYEMITIQNYLIKI